MYRVMDNTSYPGWGYMIDQGATTMWENWGGWAVKNIYVDSMYLTNRSKYVTFQLAEVAVTRNLFAAILIRIAQLAIPPPVAGCPA